MYVLLSERYKMWVHTAKLFYNTNSQIMLLSAFVSLTFISAVLGGPVTPGRIPRYPYWSQNADGFTGQRPFARENNTSFPRSSLAQTRTSSWSTSLAVLLPTRKQLSMEPRSKLGKFLVCVAHLVSLAFWIRNKTQLICLPGRQYNLLHAFRWRSWPKRLSCHRWCPSLRQSEYW